jgi:glycosyltransferase involved in cell wall biosynthesis
MRDVRILFYTAADLNLIDGSSIWMQSVVNVLHEHVNARISVLLRYPDQRRLITDEMRSLDRVWLVDGRRYRGGTAAGLRHSEAIETLERLDRAHGFDVILVRGFALALEAVKRGSFAGRLWSAYVLEPELDIRSSAYVEGMTEIARGSSRVIVQTQEMRTLLEWIVPAARGRTILLPPAIPDSPDDPAPVAHRRRLVYTGKFHPMYAVPTMIEMFRVLQAEWPDLDFHVAGDKVHRSDDTPYAEHLERGLLETSGLTWHGGISRGAVSELLREGGVALSVWEKRHGQQMNDLVVSTKLLVYCAARLPVVLNRTVAQEAVLGRDYPLFITRIDEVEGVVRRVLRDPELYAEAAMRCWFAARPFTYSAVAARLADDLQRPDQGAAITSQFDRPKQPAAAFTLGATTTPGRRAALDQAIALLRELRSADDRFRLEVQPGENAEEIARSLTAEAGVVLVDRELPRAAWLQRIGWWVGDAAEAAVPAEELAASGTLDAKGPTSMARTILESAVSGGWLELSRQRRAAARSATASSTSA